MKKILRLMFLAGAMLHLCPTTPAHAEVKEKQSPIYRPVPIPVSDGWYNGFESIVFYSNPEFDKFLANSREHIKWSKRDEFEKAIKAAKIDYRREALVLIRQTFGSGSVRIVLDEPIVNATTLEVAGTTNSPGVVTDDMAYYCYAYVVSRADIQKIDFYVNGNLSQQFSLVKSPSATPEKKSKK